MLPRKPDTCTILGSVEGIKLEQNMALVLMKDVVHLRKKEIISSWFIPALLSHLVALKKSACLAKFAVFFFIESSLQITGSYYYSC